MRKRTLGKEVAQNALQLATASLTAVPLLPEYVLAAGALAAPDNLQTRDILHLATMHRLGLTRIVSSDRAFDQVLGIERLDPLAFDTWRERILTPPA